ncbi:hypothetical protein ACFLU4_00105 [Chloroflexota bacterium]
MGGNSIKFRAGCQTTAMGIMPHNDVERALELVFSLDIPFWPQLPRVSFYEDMYTQASENLPGIVVDADEEKISLNNARFTDELSAYARKMAEAGSFSLSQRYSVVYHRFLSRELAGYTAIRGQVTGPVSFGFRVADEDSRPIIYNEETRALLFDFMQRKVSAQYQELKEKNTNAFVWLDEPGLGWVFSGLSGYNDVQARQDYRDFLAGLDGPRALHLCANVNLPYLLGLGIELLSFDAYQIELMPRAYAGAVADFIREGGVIAWGIVPTDSANLSKETPQTLARLLLGYWEVVSCNSGLPVEVIAEQALLAPARCCLKNVGTVGASDEPAAGKTGGGRDVTVEEQLVERAFVYLSALSRTLKERFSQ